MSQPADIGLPAEPRTADAADPPGVHLRARIDEQVRELLAQGEVALADVDPEGVHSLRVAVRRLRAVLKAGDIAGSDELRAELRWFFGVLGPVRDLDVLLMRFREDTQGFSAAELTAVELLLDPLVTERAAVQAKAAKVLRGKRHRRLLTALATAAASPARETTEAATAEADLIAKIAKPHQKLASAVAAMGVDPPDQELHDLRILGKKLRYAAELAAGVGGRPVRTLVKATKRLQDVLGEHQDACIAETRLRGLTPTDVDQAFVAGRLVERERVRQATMRATWYEAFVEVDQAATALAG